MPKKTELRLRKGADRRLRGGHCWVYSNEIDAAQTPLSDFQSGDIVAVASASGEIIGTAYMEPQSLICARLLAQAAGTVPDTRFFRKRITAALALRARFFDKPFYRLLYGDSDGVSGLVVDRFGDYLVVQINTAGMECYQAAVLEALVAELQPLGVLLRSDSRVRREQGLVDQLEVVHGQVPKRVALEENGVRFEVPVFDGQKTGWFYDHRNNRARLQQLSAGKRVLDVYSYIGGWGVQAAAAGASEVVCVDSSELALQAVHHNAGLNHVGERLQTLQGRADKVMEDLQARGEQFDIVVLDPPAFIQRRKDHGKGCKAYQRINELAMKLLPADGVLVSASCSMHLAESDLLDCLRGAGQRSGRRVQVVEMGSQGADHPLHPAIPETRYLKAAFALVNPAD